jgi:hypothetical protein
MTQKLLTLTGLNAPVVNIRYRRAGGAWRATFTALRPQGGMVSLCVDAGYRLELEVRAEHFKACAFQVDHDARRVAVKLTPLFVAKNTTKGQQ